jgi:hypothetical protein
MKMPRRTPARTSRVLRLCATAAVALLAGLVTGLALAAVARLTVVPPPPQPPGEPPPPGGYFATLPVGHWDSLPGDRVCAGRVHRSSWEPRPDNFLPNHRVPDRREVRRAFAERPRSRQGAYDPRWDTWLLPRVTGQFTGTTDEVLQWAACKWGIADDVLRSVAVRESGWYQHQVYPDGTCVLNSGCGDLFDDESRATREYCRTVARFVGERGAAREDVLCARTFSIVGVMSWHDPSWGRLPGDQNGTFPFNVESTAFAVDYLGSFLRGCLEGWVRWLGNTGPYEPGDLTGCLGAWYAGAWDSADAREYAARVMAERRDKPWLERAWFSQSLPCSPTQGCPQAAP